MLFLSYKLGCVGDQLSTLLLLPAILRSCHWLKRCSVTSLPTPASPGSLPLLPCFPLATSSESYFPSESSSYIASVLTLATLTSMPPLCGGPSWPLPSILSFDHFIYLLIFHSLLSSVVLLISLSSANVHQMFDKSEL